MLQRKFEASRVRVGCDYSLLAWDDVDVSADDWPGVDLCFEIERAVPFEAAQTLRQMALHA